MTSDKARLMKHLPRPALLKSESVRQYGRMLHQLTKVFHCKDYMELLLIKDVVEETWTIIRLRKAAIGVINRRAQHQQKLEARRSEQRHKDGCQKELMTAVHKDLQEEATRKEALNEMVEFAVSPILQEKAAMQEIYEAIALEGSIDYQIKLNHLIDVVYKRRNDALRQLEWYRKELAVEITKASDSIIDVETADMAADAASDTIPLVPEDK
jgi:hypothetical protein